MEIVKILLYLKIIIYLMILRARLLYPFRLSQFRHSIQESVIRNNSKYKYVAKICAFNYESNGVNHLVWFSLVLCLIMNLNIENDIQ